MEQKRYEFLMLTIFLVYHILGITAAKITGSQYFLGKTQGQHLKNNNGVR